MWWILGRARAHKMARKKYKKSYVPKPAKSARDLKANAGKGGPQTHTNKRELKGGKRGAHTLIM